MIALVAPARLLVKLRHCQRADIVGDHTTLERVRGRLDRGLGIKSGIVRILHPEPAREPLGEASRFVVGDWVRVLDEPTLRATLDAHLRTRGLLFTEPQWDFAGKVMRVARQVRRMRDDHGRFRPIARTVLLDGADCGGLAQPDAGCGRHCPLMFRDEWLAPASAPADPVVARAAGRSARVRPHAEIARGLDLLGRRDGVTFMPEMAAYAGGRFELLREITQVYEHDRWIRPRARLYLLAGLRCTGAITGARGPCDRGCRLVWHHDWLELEEEVTP